MEVPGNQPTQFELGTRSLRWHGMVMALSIDSRYEYYEHSRHETIFRAQR